MFSTIEETFLNLDCNIYPQIHQLMAIYLTLPVSVASAERSFSTLKRLKTYLRNRMSQDRLSSLALLNVHREIPINVDQVLDQFPYLGSRKLDLIL
jgi:hypothetical protein